MGSSAGTDNLLVLRTTHHDTINTRKVIPPHHLERHNIEAPVPYSSACPTAENKHGSSNYPMTPPPPLHHSTPPLPPSNRPHLLGSGVANTTTNPPWTDSLPDCHTTRHTRASYFTDSHRHTITAWPISLLSGRTAEGKQSRHHDWPAG